MENSFFLLQLQSITEVFKEHIQNSNHNPISMSREGFQIPSNLDVAAAGTSHSKAATLKYICAECSSKLSLSRTDPVRCKDCGHRILLKARTRRMVQFEAR